MYEREYFDKAFDGKYERRTPLRKRRYYLNEMRRLKPSGRLLDIGCAYGLFLKVAKEYYDVSGCDLSEYALARARKNLPGVKLFRSDILSIDEYEKYDVVTCFDILEHVADLDSAMEKVRKLLVGDGIFVMTTSVYDTIAGHIVRLLDKDETHIWKEGRGFWREKMKAHGFRLLKDIGVWKYLFFGRYYAFFAGSGWKNFSPTIFHIAQKDDIHSSSGI